MRIGIREQLALLVALAALLPLAVIAIAVWFNNYNFVVDIKSSSLSLTASLKAGEIASAILLIQSTLTTISTRIVLQSDLRRFYQSNGSNSVLASGENDLSQALESGGLPDLLQLTLFSRNTTGNPNGILNITSTAASDIILPSTYPNGTHYHLGDRGLGYPPQLYPNITYTRTNDPDPLDPTTDVTLVNAFSDYPLNSSSILLLGPVQINSTYSIFSLTIPLLDTTRKGFVLGYMTAVASAASILRVVQSKEGLGDTGVVLLVGPQRRENHFSAESQPANAVSKPSPSVLATTPVRYVFPPVPQEGKSDRHSEYTKNISMYGSSAFVMGRYPAVVNGFGRRHFQVNNASSMLSTKNEDGSSVSVGFARPQTNLVDWLLVVELSHSEAWAPIVHLRNIILACVFGTVGLIILVVVPMAHFGVRPIRRLRDATEKTVAPPGYSEHDSLESEDEGSPAGDMERTGTGGFKERMRPNIFVRLRRLRRKRRRIDTMTTHSDEHRRRGFRIPGKVPERKHWITDELTELTSTFNAMSDELLSQYSILEEKVAERTQQLEISKKAAEAANESKTLFIANISHELKTPLNGILGMCAVCMGEDDLPRIKKSLQVVYKSGDLLLHLLDDVLTFSKNQIGQQLNLEEKEFRLADIRSQVVAIFEKQAREGNIDFSVKFIGSDDSETAPDVSPPAKPLPALAPGGIGRLKDLCLWGDQYRILQVLINLVSNSLKFTPKEGSVQVRIRCLGEAEVSSDKSRISISSKQGSGRGSRTSRRGWEGSQGSSSKFTANGSRQVGTALLINPMEPNPRFLQMGDRPSTPPPPGAKVLMFEFEVEDTGPGIPKHLQERVFEPFVQADLGLSKKFGGTGLGLSICSQLATLMSGDISLTSTEGVGSTFTMRIPLKFIKERAPSTSSSDIVQGSQAASVKSFEDRSGTKNSFENKAAANVSRTSSLSFNKDAKPRLVGFSQPFFASSPPSTAVQDSDEHIQALENAASSKKKIRVLVAEDNLVNQEVVLRMLKLEDVYDVVVAKDGQEAYDMVKESMEKGRLFNLIFMDIQMPNLDGLQSTRLIRQMGYQAPIVALTAFAEESNVKECYDSGMNMFLSKPIRRPALKHVLKTFATIPEENESSSTRRSGSDAGTPEDSNESNEAKSPIPDGKIDGVVEKSTDN
ncbi:histidine kinase-group VI protein [Xylogone sp. PMI_703]|nr:histidine kinase-group VI protein [Xylogone sp. PMI_703]